MGQTSTLGFHDRSFGRWLARQIYRHIHRLTDQVFRVWKRRRRSRATRQLWRIDEKALLRAEIHPKDVIHQRDGRTSA